MWNESSALTEQANAFTADAAVCVSTAEDHERAAGEHERAAVTETAAARANRNAAAGKTKIATGKNAEAADLADMVNEKRAAMNLPPLVSGQPYPPPADGGGEEDAGQPIAGAAPENGALPPGVVPVAPGDLALDPAGTTRHDSFPPVAQTGLPGGGVQA
jgi:hypothetical protein